VLQGKKLYFHAANVPQFGTLAVIMVKIMLYECHISIGGSKERDDQLARTISNESGTAENKQADRSKWSI
jgi:hypothetical protein